MAGNSQVSVQWKESIAKEGENRLIPIHNPAISGELIDEGEAVEVQIKTSSESLGGMFGRLPPDGKRVGGAQSRHWVCADDASLYWVSVLDSQLGPRRACVEKLGLV